MGEGKNGMTAEVSTPPPERLEREVEAIRGNLDGIVSELDLRRHELTDWRLQARRHRGTLILVGTMLLAVAATFIAFAIRDRRLKRRMAASGRGMVRRLRRKLAGALDDTEKLARPSPTVGQKIAVAAGTTIAATASKLLVSRVLQSGPSRQGAS
jgi:hypothetical protein